MSADCRSGDCPLVRLFKKIRSALKGGERTEVIHSIDCDDVSSWQERGARLVDVRETWEFEAGHIPEALNLPLSEVTEKLQPDGRPVVLICASGGRSGQAARLLRRQGFSELANLTGGTNGWARRGKPINRGG